MELKELHKFMFLLPCHERESLSKHYIKQRPSGHHPPKEQPTVHQDKPEPLKVKGLQEFFIYGDKDLLLSSKRMGVKLSAKERLKQAYPPITLGSCKRSTDYNRLIKVCLCLLSMRSKLAMFPTLTRALLKNLQTQMKE
jgi:hypothetical protein